MIVIAPPSPWLACPWCGRRVFRSRHAAKRRRRALRRQGASVSVYTCTIGGLLHVGPVDRAGANLNDPRAYLDPS
jgi:4-hydroxy-3-methylbut-2-en-1-yl diphosphate synthase IspG/GcpE